MSFVLDDSAHLTRFLILGADGGTYYVREHRLVRENAVSSSAASRRITRAPSTSSYR